MNQKSTLIYLTMTSKKSFQNFWTKNYPETQPINYLFKTVYSDRWLRIHNLPESKRYADSEEEYNIIFDRQNQIISDLVPHNSSLNVVINYIDIHNSLFKTYDLINLGTYIDREAETVFQSFLFTVSWEAHAFNHILKQIANDELRAFFVNENYLISPYDGGIDIIFLDSTNRDFYKNKYQAWLSDRADGL